MGRLPKSLEPAWPDCANAQDCHKLDAAGGQLVSFPARQGAICEEPGAYSPRPGVSLVEKG